MVSNELMSMSAWQLAQSIRNKQLSPIEVTTYFLDRIKANNSSLNAFITVAEEEAKITAAEAESRIMSGDIVGPLHGVPISIKDLSATKGLRTTLGTLLSKDWIPDYDDIPVERLRAAGAIIIGKTNTPEYGWKGTTENLLIGASRNPWDLSRTPGGSSGGSAAAVSARLTPIALGSDAGGSIRIPSSFSGIFGMKPSFGRVPTDHTGKGGWRPFSQNGPMTHNVKDAALLLSILSGADSRDTTCIQDQSPDFDLAVSNPAINGMTIAWSPNLDGRPVDPEVQNLTRSAVKVFEDLGAFIIEDSPVIQSDELVEIFKVIILTDLAMELGPILGTESEAFLPPTLVEWTTEAVNWPATRLAATIRDLENFRGLSREFFERYDFLITPTMAVPAFPIETPPAIIDGFPVDPNWGYTPFCYPFNLSGNPAANIPCGHTKEGLPVGLQVVGGAGRDIDVLRACAAFEQTHPFSDLPPLLGM